jgi:hypothetical protein
MRMKEKVLQQTAWRPVNAEVGLICDQMEKLYSRITEQARYEYALAYVPRVYGTSSNYHVVRVETTREGLLVETRRGYYASSATAVPKN